MAEYIWALDIAMKNTGIAIFDLDGNIIKVCSVETKDKDSHGKRLKVIADYITELKELYPADKVIIERAFSHFNISTSVLYKCHGICNYIFWDKEQIYYPPKTIKAELLNGKATKKQIQECIISHYPDIKFENEDMSDAVSIGLCYMIKNKIIDWR